MHQHCRPSQRGLVSAALRELFQAEDGEQASERVGQVIERLEPSVPKVCRLLEDAASAIRLAGALLIEQNDEWLVCRRYLSAESMALLDAVKIEDPIHQDKGEEVVELNAA